MIISGRTNSGERFGAGQANLRVCVCVFVFLLLFVLCRIGSGRVLSGISTLQHFSKSTVLHRTVQDGFQYFNSSKLVSAYREREGSIFGVRTGETWRYPP